MIATENVYEEMILNKIRHLDFSNLNKILWIIDDLDLIQNSQVDTSTLIEQCAGRFKNAKANSYDFAKNKQSEKELE